MSKNRPTYHKVAAHTRTRKDGTVQMVSKHFRRNPEGSGVPSSDGPQSSNSDWSLGEIVGMTCFAVFMIWLLAQVFGG